MLTEKQRREWDEITRLLKHYTYQDADSTRLHIAVADHLVEVETQLAAALARREREQAVLEAVAEWVGLDSGADVFTRMAAWNKIRTAYAVLAAEQQQEGQDNA